MPRRPRATDPVTLAARRLVREFGLNAESVHAMSRDNMQGAESFARWEAVQAAIGAEFEYQLNAYRL